MLRIGKSVRVDLPPDIEFHADLIDYYQVKSLYYKTYDPCEHWGWNDEGEEGLPYYDFAMIGRDYHVNIFKDKTYFFCHEGLAIGYKIKEPTKLFYIDKVDHSRNDIEIVTERHAPEWTFNRVPVTVLDFAMMINSFLLHIESDFADTALMFLMDKRERDYKDFLQRKASQVNAIEDDDDLPF